MTRIKVTTPTTAKVPNVGKITSSIYVKNESQFSNKKYEVIIQIFFFSMQTMNHHS